MRFYTSQSKFKEFSQILEEEIIDINLTASNLKMITNSGKEYEFYYLSDNEYSNSKTKLITIEGNYCLPFFVLDVKINTKPSRIIFKLKAIEDTIILTILIPLNGDIVLHIKRLSDEKVEKYKKIIKLKQL